MGSRYSLGLHPVDIIGLKTDLKNKLQMDGYIREV